MPGEQPVLEMQGISKKFPGVQALDSVDFEVYPAEIVAMIGENGAGKSTLMNILGGIHPADSGILRYAGREVYIRTVADSIALGISFIHQELNILDNLTVAENVFLNREPLWGGPLQLIDRKKICEMTVPYLEKLGYHISPDTPINRLSIAQRQMVEIAKALSQSADVLIMDEPTSSLTLDESERLFSVMQELRAQGVSIIYISHRLAEVEKRADRIIGLRDGKNSGRLSRGEINHDEMIKLMVGRKLNTFNIARKECKATGSFRVVDLVTKEFPGSSVTFEVVKGEILGFAGLVGAGRSEMARTIFGVDERIGGKFFLEDQELKIVSARDAIAYGLFLVPEERRKHGLLTGLSVCENISLPDLKSYSHMGLMQRRHEIEKSSHHVKQLNIKTASLKTKAGNLSGGNQQKLVLAKWMAMKPRVLIFDEPTKGIDVVAKVEIYRLMRDLADRGVIVIIISSDMEEILTVSDRISVMCNGKITGVLERKEFDEEKVMELAVRY
jgi:ribose transport system ATP-binding protein